MFVNEKECLSVCLSVCLSGSDACRSLAPDFCIRLSEHLAKEADNLVENTQLAPAHTISQFVNECFPPNLFTISTTNAHNTKSMKPDRLSIIQLPLYVVQNSIHPKIYRNFMYDSALLPQQNTFVGLSIDCFCLYSFLVVS